VGDRGIIDALLNKPMITVDGQVSKWLNVWFRSADVLQLLAMTFAAAQKGWDGVALVILMLFDWAVVFIANIGSRVVLRFMKNNDLSIKVWTLDFPGKSSKISDLPLSYLYTRSYSHAHGYSPL
jgi:hypothetical protein